MVRHWKRDWTESPVCHSRKVLKLGREAAKGLAHLHSLEIIHRDIQPANIWVTSSGHAKLMEFGAASDALSELDEGETDELAEIYRQEHSGQL